MRTILIALTMSFILPLAARAADRLSPETFVGTYKLVDARYGLLCDGTMQGLLSHSIDRNDSDYVQIDLGAFPFTAVNNGAQHFEDEFAVTDSQSYTTADSLVFESKEVSKVDGEVSTEKTVAKLTGLRLHLVSLGAYKHPGGTRGSTSFDCVYEKVDSGK